MGVNLYRSDLQRDDDDLPGFEIGYPGSAKVGIWPGNEEDQLILPRGAAVGYYEGESGES